SQRVLRDRLTPKRASMRSQRYSGRWSQNLLTMTWASSPGPARPRAMGEGGRGAVRNVDTAGCTGARYVAAVSVNADTENDADAVFGVSGAEGAAGATGAPAWRCFSQQGQA